jgi:hypothetical protein
MENLFEGLKEGDLEDLVLPLISVDEYESKLDDDSVVVAFYVMDRDPAQDLNRFVQKGASAILDTDVSPAPNEDGYYMVFVELLRDENMPKKLMNTLESLSGLTGIQNWKAQMYDVEGVLPATDEVIRRHVRLVSEVDHAGHEDEVEEGLTEFFRASDLDNLVVEGKKVTMEARGVTVELQYVDLDSMEAVNENNAAMGSATRLDETANANCRRIQRMLGDFWFAEQRGNHVLVTNPLSETVALFRL